MVRQGKAPEEQEDQLSDDVLHEYSLAILQEKGALTRLVTEQLLQRPDGVAISDLRYQLTRQKDEGIDPDHKVIADRVAEYVNATFEGITGA